MQRGTTTCGLALGAALLTSCAGHASSQTPPRDHAPHAPHPPPTPVASPPTPLPPRTPAPPTCAFVPPGFLRGPRRGPARAARPAEGRARVTEPGTFALSLSHGGDGSVLLAIGHGVDVENAAGQTADAHARGTVDGYALCGTGWVNLGPLSASADLWEDGPELADGAYAPIAVDGDRAHRHAVAFAGGGWADVAAGVPDGMTLAAVVADADDVAVVATRGAAEGGVCPRGVVPGGDVTLLVRGRHADGAWRDVARGPLVTDPCRGATSVVAAAWRDEVVVAYDDCVGRNAGDSFTMDDCHVIVSRVGHGSARPERLAPVASLVSGMDPPGPLVALGPDGPVVASVEGEGATRGIHVRTLEQGRWRELPAPTSPRPPAPGMPACITRMVSLAAAPPRLAWLDCPPGDFATLLRAQVLDAGAWHDAAPALDTARESSVQSLPRVAVAWDGASPLVAVALRRPALVRVHRGDGHGWHEVGAFDHR